MVRPNLKSERLLWSKGVKWVVGIDEVGRGALAGPVVAAAVCFDKNCLVINGVRDSKMLTEGQRQKLATIICSQANFWAIASVPVQIIDKVGIAQATYLAMYRAATFGIKNIFCLIDGNIYPKVFIKNIVDGKAIIRGDQYIYSISCASIIAKVFRDNLMINLTKQFPEYGWENNKGYGTEQHRVAINELGTTKIHRKSFTFAKR